MFFPRKKPLSVAPAQVRGLRLSLNTPVIATEELPVGPARAALLLHDGERGETVTIGIRSLRVDRAVLYELDEDAGTGASLDVVLDAALSFAESMGFLFDEDEIGSGGAAGRSRCHGLWRDLLEKPSASRPSAAPHEPEELLLEELADDATEVVAPGADPLELAGGAEGAAETDGSAQEAADPEPPEPEPLDRSDAEIVARLAAAAGGGRRALPLTKFRGAPPARAAEGGARAPREAASRPARGGEDRPQRGKAALGRLRLVRRKSEGSRKRNPLLRLFGAF